MMVRFSDIIKIKDKDKKIEKETPAEKNGGDSFRLSDSQQFKIFNKNDKLPIDTSPVEDKADSGRDITSNYKKFIERAIDVRQKVKADQGISPSPVLSDLHTIIHKRLIDGLYEYAVSAQPDYDDMLVHTIDVTFTSLKVGKGMGYDSKNLLCLGLSAFLENVGMYRIPDTILIRSGKLDKEEIRIIKSHPEISAEILGRIGQRYQWLADIALQIHERYDGSGYPKGLKGDEISELAAIIGLVDVYMAMIKKKPYREKFMQTDAIKSIIEASKGLFPPKIVKIFLSQISLFPVNSYVRLNNQSIGRVISTHGKQPLRPTIELLYDGLGNKVKDRQIINLSENQLLYIDRSVNEKELQ